jgi:fermentation-respiration switch protein FrsA (DUF1100 family)
MAERKNIEFGVEGGVTLRGWLFVPGAKGPAPAITMAHGYAGVKEHGLERFARAFAEAGFVVLVHDHRHFGASDGAERGDVDPWQQIADWRRAISFLESRPEVDAAQIGIWGTSYAGGHAIVLGATDRRLKAVVAQVPTISGFEQGLRRVAPDGIAALERAFAEDDRGQLRGEPLRRQLVVSDDLAIPASYHNKDAIDFYLQPTPPGIWMPRVSPTPLLMVVALSDTMTVTDLALAAYQRALEPKRLQLISGGHFAPYLDQFPLAVAAATEWFSEHLLNPGARRVTQVAIHSASAQANSDIANV